MTPPPNPTLSPMVLARAAPSWSRRAAASRQWAAVSSWTFGSIWESAPLATSGSAVAIQAATEVMTAEKRPGSEPGRSGVVMPQPSWPTTDAEVVVRCVRRAVRLPRPANRGLS